MVFEPFLVDNFLWTQKRIETARLYDQGLRPSQIRKKGYTDFVKVGKERKRVIENNLPKPWENGHRTQEQIPPHEESIVPQAPPPPKSTKSPVLFKIKVKEEELSITTEELVDIYELWWAFREEGYVGTPMQLAKSCMVKIAQLLDIRPKLFMEVITNDGNRQSG